MKTIILIFHFELDKTASGEGQKGLMDSFFLKKSGCKMAALLISCMMMAFSQAESSAGNELAIQEARLKEVCHELKSELGEALYEIVEHEQKKWMEYRAHISEFQGQHESDPKKQREAQLEMATALTKERIEWLQAWKSRPKGAEVIRPGIYEDGYGGLLEIACREGQTFFHLNVVRGPTSHVGDIGGDLKVNGTLGFFEYKSESKKELTWIFLSPTLDGSGRIAVRTENAKRFAGMRAYFDADYLYTGPIDDKNASALIKGDYHLE